MCGCSFFRYGQLTDEEGEEGAAQVSARLVDRMCWCIKEPFRFESPPPSHSHARALSQGSTSFSMGSCYGTLAVANQELLTAHGQRISKEDLLDLMEANFLQDQYLTNCGDFTYITMDDMEAAVKAFLPTHPGIDRAIVIGETPIITPKSNTTLWYVRKLGGELFRPSVIWQNKRHWLYGLTREEMGTQPSTLPALTARRIMSWTPALWLDPLSAVKASMSTAVASQGVIPGNAAMHSCCRLHIAMWGSFPTTSFTKPSHMEGFTFLNLSHAVDGLGMGLSPLPYSVGLESFHTCI